jgi:hypothetical protein
MAPEDPTATVEPMIRELMWVERPEGTHLSRAGIAGGYSSLARDEVTNELETHATLYPVGDDKDEDEPGPSPAGSPALQVLAGVLLAVGAIEAGRRLAPYAKGWWDDLALPSAVTSTWHKLTGTCSTNPDSAQEVVLAPAEPDVRMSSAEARERLIAALMDRLSSDEQLRILRNARIEDEDVPPELARAMAALTPEHVGTQLQLALEADPLLAHDEVVAELRRILGGTRFDGELLPSADEKITVPHRLIGGRGSVEA